MICHERKCIFIHLQRTGGTAIENFFVKKDQWKFEKEYKHLLASQAKKIYKDYWNDYFKFTIIRDPWARIYSLVKKFPETTIDRLNGKILNSLTNYSKKITYNEIPFEIDSRFFSIAEEVEKFDLKKSQMYSNMIGDEMDLILNYDHLREELPILLEKINVKFDLNSVIVPTQSYEDYFTEETKNIIFEMHKDELSKFDFEFGKGKINNNVNERHINAG